MEVRWLRAGVESVDREGGHISTHERVTSERASNIISQTAHAHFCFVPRAQKASGWHHAERGTGTAAR